MSIINKLFKTSENIVNLKLKQKNIMKKDYQKFIYFILKH